VTDVGITLVFTPLKEVAKAVAPHANLSGLEKAEGAIKDGLHQAVDNIEGRIDGIVDAGAKTVGALGHAYELAKQHKWNEAANSLEEAGKDLLDLGLAFIPPEVQQAAIIVGEKVGEAAIFAADKMAQGLKYVDMVLDKAIEIGLTVVMHSPVMMLVKLAAPEVADKIEHAVTAAADAVNDMVKGTLDAAVNVVKSAGQMVGALAHGDLEGAGKAAFSGVMSAAVVGMTVVDGVAVIAETAAAAVLSDFLPPEAASILASAVTMTTPRGIAKNIMGAVDNVIPTTLISNAVGGATKAVGDVAGDLAKAAGDMGSTVIAKLGSATDDIAGAATKRLDDIPVTDNQMMAAGLGAEVVSGVASSSRKAPNSGLADDLADGATPNAPPGSRHGDDGVDGPASNGKAHDADAPKAKESDDPKTKDKDASTKDKDASTKDKADEAKTDDAAPSKKKKKKDDDDDNDLDLSGLFQPGFGGGAGRGSIGVQKTTQNKLDYLLADYAGGIARAAASDPSSSKARTQQGAAGRPLPKVADHSSKERLGKSNDQLSAPEPAAATTESQPASRPVATQS
jgi:hypothetical protein